MSGVEQFCRTQKGFLWWHISVLPAVGGVPPVPRKLHHHDPLRLHLAHPLPRHLEVSINCVITNNYLK